MLYQTLLSSPYSPREEQMEAARWRPFNSDVDVLGTRVTVVFLTRSRILSKEKYSARSISLIIHVNFLLIGWCLFVNLCWNWAFSIYTHVFFLNNGFLFMYSAVWIKCIVLQWNIDVVFLPRDAYLFIYLYLCWQVNRRTSIDSASLWNFTIWYSRREDEI